MKWNGQHLVLIQLNLNLHINLDVDEKQSIFLNLPDGIWTMILKYLSTVEVFSFKFLCKRFYKISFYDKKLKFFTINARKIFEVNDYYENFFYLLEDLFKKLKKEFDEITFIFLKYSFEDLKNLFMISNCFFHLFSCPRSIFAKSDCKHCSRLYFSPFIRPKNFKLLNEFKFMISDEQKNTLSDNSLSILKRFSIVVFFESLEESSTINSDKKRCLKTFIIQDYFHLVIIFFEVQIRIFCNFFSKIVDDCYIDSYEKKIFFLEECFIFCFKFVSYCVRNVKFSFFHEIFSQYEYSDFNLKVINKKYIEYCEKKYASKNID